MVPFPSWAENWEGKQTALKDQPVEATEESTPASWSEGALRYLKYKEVFRKDCMGMKEMQSSQEGSRDM